jgi:hypothetical protein
VSKLITLLNATAPFPNFEKTNYAVDTTLIVTICYIKCTFPDLEQTIFYAQCYLCSFGKSIIIDIVSFSDVTLVTN